MTSAHTSLTLNRHLPLVAEDHRIPLLRDNVLVLCALFEDEIDEESWSPRSDRALDSEYFTSNNFHCHVLVLVARNVLALELLVLRLAKLAFRVEIQPQLETDRGSVEAGRHLSMDNSLASGHPLDVARAK